MNRYLDRFRLPWPWTQTLFHWLWTDENQQKELYRRQLRSRTQPPTNLEEGLDDECSDKKED